MNSAGGVSIDFGEGGFEGKLASMPDVPAAAEPNQGGATRFGTQRQERAKCAASVAPWPLC